MSKIAYAHLSLFLVNAFYGASHVIAKGVMPTFLTPEVFIFLRVSVATSLFFLLYFTFKRESIQRKDLGLFALCGLFGVAINQEFFFAGLNLSSAINSGIIMTTNPLIVLILAALFLKERITKRKLIGIFIAALGAIYLTLQSGSIHTDALLGDAFLFINSISYAIYLILSKPLMQRYSPLTVITFVFSFGTVFVLLYPPTLYGVQHTQFSQIPTEAWYKITYVIIAITFLAYLLTMFGLKYVSAATASSYIYFQPVMVIVFAYVFELFGMSAQQTAAITIQKMIAMVIVFFGLWLVNSNVNNPVKGK